MVLPLLALGQDKKAPPTIAEKTQGMQAFEGYFPFYWDEREGKIWLEINRFDEEILYVNSLPAGIGSNDIGLDRGQLGDTRIVFFRKVGPKVLMVQPNYDYRAISDNPDERAAVEEAFAQSVLWGFKAEAVEGKRVLVDFTPYLMQDAHNVIGRLRQSSQGTYRLDESRSAVYLPMTKNFPQNSEWEVSLTFTGDPAGAYIRSVVPTPSAVTVRQHHSFVQLPDSGYKPRPFDPRSGYFPISYYDYATPISAPVVQRFIRRHRLEKKDPAAAMSEPVEPIVYYLDRGAPEPIKSALMEGARWWNQAFEAAGYKDAFIVKELPVDADPMDVRYNLIQWVHRSTRGWSYGASVTDPRTGEIIKGKVTLGSLRVRQDFLIASGLLAPYEKGEQPDPKIEQMALARLRQLSAHEVGHTLGLAHNYASSVNDRASVMDYPHPYVTMDAQGQMDFSKAYDTGIAAWDKRAILYGYQDFAPGTDEKTALRGILEENIRMGVEYLADQDARPLGSASPIAHLWDNGASATAELKRLSGVRKAALERFSAANIPPHTPMAELEHVLAPLYLAHRYQVEAAAKLVGGVNYKYAVRGDGQVTNEMVAAATQREALQALLETLAPDFLALPENVIQMIPPYPVGYSRDRESFDSHTGLTFDPMAAAESSVNHTVGLLLHPERLARLVEQSARKSGQLSATEVITAALRAGRITSGESGYHQELHRMIDKAVFMQLLSLAADPKINQQVSALALNHAQRKAEEAGLAMGAGDQSSHQRYLQYQLALFKQHPESFLKPYKVDMPDGAPIGCGD